MSCRCLPGYRPDTDWGLGVTNSRGQGLEQVLPQLQSHQVGQTERKAGCEGPGSSRDGHSSHRPASPTVGTHLPMSPGSACRDTSFRAR